MELQRCVRRKLPFLLPFEPDLLVVQEASERDIRALDVPFVHWVGRRHAVWPSSASGTLGYRARSCRSTRSCPGSLPLHVDSIRLLAVWASVLTSRLRYVRLLHLALDRYGPFLDTPTGPSSATSTATQCSTANTARSHTPSSSLAWHSMDYSSAWHHQHNEPHGSESHPTFYLYRRTDRTWHLDYAFLTDSLLAGATLTLGQPEDWLAHSDHLPLVLDIPE